MEIVWLGHSCIRIKSLGVTLITDPYADSLGLSMGSHAADIVTISHDHPHHASSEAVEGEPRVLTGPGEYEIGDFYIIGTGTPGEQLDEGRAINTVFTIRAEGLTLCHLGDLKQRLSSGQVEDLNQADVLFVPAGGGTTIDTSSLVALINLIGPRIVVPMHYWTEGLRVELGPLDSFLADMGVSEASPQPRLNVTATNLPRDLRVVVLQREI